jgi:hypothetical protein
LCQTFRLFLSQEKERPCLLLFRFDPRRIDGIFRPLHGLFVRLAGIDLFHLIGYIAYDIQSTHPDIRLFAVCVKVLAHSAFPGLRTHARPRGATVLRGFRAAGIVAVDIGRRHCLNCVYV